MAASLGKRVLKWTLLITPWMLVLALAAGWGFPVWTPKYLETLVPQLAADMGIELTEFHIRDAGLFSADIGPVKLGGNETALHLSNVHVTYTPASLKQGRVNRVILDGVTLPCSFDGTTFSLPILDLLPKSEGNTTPNELPSLPFEELVIRDSELQCEISGTPLSIPISGTLSPGKTYDFKTRITPRDQIISLAGSLGPTANALRLNIATQGFRLGAFDDFMPKPVKGAMGLSLKADVDLQHLDALTASFDLSVADCDLSTLDLELATDAVIDIKGKIAEKEITYTAAPVTLAAPFPATLGIRSGRASKDSLFTQFTLAGAGVEMGGRFEADKVGDLWDVSLTAVNPDNLVVDTNGRVIRLAGFTFSLAGMARPDQADMVLNCSTKGAALGDSGFKSRDLRLTLPLKYPAPKRHTPGTLTMSGLRMDNRKLGTVSARIRQQGTDVAYGGTLFTELLPGLRIPFSGLASMISNAATLKFSIDRYRLPDDFDPATVLPDMKDISLSGELDMSGGVHIDENGMESRVDLIFKDGHLGMSEGATTIDNIRLAFEVPDLMAFRSAPAQKLQFDALQAGNIRIENGEVNFQLEPDGVFLIEEAGFDWCGGHVASRAFRIVPDSKEYGVTLFCSQLKLSEILSQLGLAKARGQAAMSGELPVTWKNGKISFNSGFLHSTPGEGGTIQVEAMQDLVAAIPKGTPQRGQLELAQAAVRDFEYKWVRIKADTIGEDLLVRLSVDGKPASTLPFVYRKEFGGFMQVEGDVKGSNFQGLRLDVNFSVPLDRILLYKDIMNMIE